MAKQIFISDETYHLLNTMKHKGDSFSKVILRNIKSKGNKEEILSLAGSDTIDKKEIKKQKKDWEKWQKKFA